MDTRLEDLVRFIEDACAGHNMAGTPPPFYRELKEAAKGNAWPLIHTLRQHQARCEDCIVNARLTQISEAYCPNCD